MTKEVRSQNGAAADRDSRSAAHGRARDLSTLGLALQLAGAFLFATGLAAEAQLGPPVETNLFGDEIVQKIGSDEDGERSRRVASVEGSEPKPALTGFAQALFFQDGRQLRGELVELTKSEVVWRRPDARTLLRFAREEVRRVVVAESAGEGGGKRADFDGACMEAFALRMLGQFAHGVGGILGEAVTQAVMLDLGRAVRIPNVLQVMTREMTATMKEVGMPGFAEMQEAAEEKDEAKEAEAEEKAEVATATVKLPGGDWLFGSVTSGDGENFALKLADGTSLAIPRDSIAWLHFGRQPAPAFGFAGGELDLESWTVRTAGARTEVADGSLTLRDGWVLGRALTPPKRFEVAFEVAEESHAGLRLWIQPFGPQPNSWGTGTIQLIFAKDQIQHCIYMGKMARKTDRVSKEASAQKGPFSYRVLYDGIDQHVAVLRNGVPLGDWKFREKDDDANRRAANDAERIMIKGVCFDSAEHGKQPGLKFNRLNVQPWDGIVPVAGAEEQAGDRLTVGKQPVEVGRLETVGEEGLTFSGAQKPRVQGTFIRLQKIAPSLADADAMLVFGQQGEVSVAGLEIRDGRALGRATFAPALDLPATALQTIAFPSRLAKSSPPLDALVFKNGDELRGTLLAAAAGGTLRWKLAGGQEIELESAHVAGVRFAAGLAVPPTGKPVTIELRNGDRLRGESVRLDARELEFQNAEFGRVVIAREQLWSLYPQARFGVTDGSCDVARWLGEPPADGASASSSPRAQEMDGSYLFRPEPNGTTEGDHSLTTPPGTVPDRFEIRVDATTGDGQAPALGVTLSAAGEKGSIEASLYDFELTLSVDNPQTNRRPIDRTLSIREKIPEPSSRIALRVFVDRKAGTADFFLDGALVARVGQRAAERLPGIGEVVTLTARLRGSPVVLSNLWLGPWNGDLPRLGEGRPATTALANGDLAPNAPEKMEAEKFSVESEAGLIELPLEKAVAVEFGGVMTPAKVAGRIRLADGGMLHVAGFRWEGGELSAQSPTLGEVRLAASQVREILFDPAPIRPPRSPVARKLARETPAAPEDVPDATKAP